MNLRLGIVGAGAMGAKVAAVADRIGGARVTAVVDRDQDRARSLAGAHQARPYADIAGLAASGEVDAVYIGVPHDQHLAACTEAAAVGLHALIDKPLCNTLDEAQRIIEARDAAGVQLMVGFSYRFRAEWLRAREFVAAGLIGTPRLVTDTLIEADSNTPAWYWKATAGGGVLQLQSHHCFDRLAWILGDDFEKIGCQVTQFPGSAEDVAIINAATSGGTLVSIDIGYGRRYSARARPTTVIQGDRGHIVIDQHRVISIETEDGTRQEFDCSADDWLLSELSAFTGLCTGSTAAVPSAEDGRAALECALASAESARAGGSLVHIR